jgi:hypothetical protein
MPGVKISELPPIVSPVLTDIFPEVQPATGGTTFKTTFNELLTLFEAHIEIPASQITNGASLTSVNDTNITLTLGGSPAVSLLAATSLTLGWTGTLSPSRGGTGAANSGSFTWGGAVTFSGAFTTTLTVTGNTSLTLPTSGTLATTSQLPTPAALTESNDTNVTLTLSGTPSTALLQAVSLTLGWTGTLSPDRGGTGINNGTSTITIGGNITFSGAFTFAGTITGNTAVTFPISGTLATTSQIPTGAALTESNDTNITLTLGGSPSTALVNAASITAGWSGTLAYARGGLGAAITASNGGIFYSTASNAALLTATTTANQMLLSGASGAPSWSTVTMPSTIPTHQILYTNGANVIAGVTVGNGGVFITSNLGVPSWLNTANTNSILLSNNFAAPVWSSTAYLNTIAINSIVYASAANTMAALAPANNAVLSSGGTGVPAMSTTLPSALTIPLPLISGVINASNAAAGNVGEVISSVIASASAISPSNATPTNLTSISLTAGDWDVYANVSATFSGSGSFLVVWISTTSATLPDRSLYSEVVPSALAEASAIPAPYQRINVSSTTTTYVSFEVGFSTGAASVCGGIYARRAR